ncbi:MgtC/SapB family protein [Bisbaumannia pacifica]|uniref:DUF4010 domain-containing protein n=1 Tax=Bisbaumannia pacifica TaxID=77098 RepID=A0ABD4L4F9_9GAMM|nr:DUF4010 domain-containing protein [Halomonas pacifica]MBH8581639.1 DUF4010 domain-containing protein [Halomonas pacifica]
MEAFVGVGVALFSGLLIGLERGWKQSGLPESSRAMGLRTFALIGLGGGVSGLLGEAWGAALPAAIGLGLTLLLTVVYWRSRLEQRDAGCTTEVAGLLTFVLGAAAAAGYPAQAAAGAVVAALLLQLKAYLHDLLTRISAAELRGTLMLLLISVAVLPLLPDRGFGPFAALNPYLIWWMVVLVAAIQFAGYVLVRLLGSRYGILLTGLVAGLMASTPLALAFARLGRRQPELAPTLVCAILAASSMMFPRALAVASLIAPGILPTLAVPLLGMTGLGFGLAAGLWWWTQRRDGADPAAPSPPVSNPFELWPAVRFGALLAGIFLAVAAARHWLGDSGLYGLALISGLTDVDPVTLSFARLAADEQSWALASRGIVLAALANTLFKSGLVAVLGGARMGGWMLVSVTPALLFGVAWLVW